MSSSLIKLIDAALVPASVMIVGKLVSLYGVMIAFGIGWDVQQLSNSFFSHRTAVNANTINILSTYSDLFLLIIMTMGLAIAIIYSLRHPGQKLNLKLIHQLITFEVADIWRGSVSLYYNVTIWLVFLWATALTILINVLLGKTEPLILVLATAISIGFSLGVVRLVVAKIKSEADRVRDRHALTS